METKLRSFKDYIHGQWSSLQPLVTQNAPKPYGRIPLA